jgi:hypothetical protein
MYQYTQDNLSNRISGLDHQHHLKIQIHLEYESMICFHCHQFLLSCIFYLLTSFCIRRSFDHCIHLTILDELNNVKLLFYLLLSYPITISHTQLFNLNQVHHITSFVVSLYIIFVPLHPTSF